MFVGHFLPSLDPDCESGSGYRSRDPIASGSNPDPDPDPHEAQLNGITLQRLVALTGGSSSPSAHLPVARLGGGGRNPRKELTASATDVCRITLKTPVLRIRDFLRFGGTKPLFISFLHYILYIHTHLTFIHHIR